MPRITEGQTINLHHLNAQKQSAIASVKCIHEGSCSFSLSIYRFSQIFILWSGYLEHFKQNLFLSYLEGKEMHITFLDSLCCKIPVD